MKHFVGFLLVAAIFFPKKNLGQCNYGSLQPLVIGQVISDTAFCPSGGKITLNNITGGGGYYAYEIVSGPVIRIVQSQNSFNALPAGTYRVRVTSCNGKLKDTLVTVVNRYTSISIYNWQQGIERLSGLECGITNNGVYKIKKPGYSGGTPPYRIQVSATSNFTAIPYEPGYDSAVINGLNQNTTYYVRITDACNNFQTTNFTTPPATPVAPLSVPSLTFARAYWTSSCSGNETVNIGFTDSATGAPYNVNNLYSNKVFWGNKALPYLRMKIEDAVNGTVYADRHFSVAQFSNIYNISTNFSYNGETGLTAPGYGYVLYGYANAVANVLPNLYVGSEFPANANLKITVYFPGGDHCGTPVAPYNKTFFFNLGTHGTTQAKIVAANNNCSSSSGSYFRVDFNMNFFQGRLSLIDPSPVYSVLKSDIIYSNSSTFATIYYSPLILGHTYRLLLEDTCGRKDSMDVVYNPGGGLVPPPVITDTVRAEFKCPANPNDSVYTIFLKPFQPGYNILRASITGIGNVTAVAIPNWNGGTQTAYKLNKLLAPGNYTYKIVWLYQCQTDSITNNITISPEPSSPLYTDALNLSVTNSSLSCSADGYTSIQLNGFLRNINTNYRITNLRLTGVPNNYVFPLKQIIGSNIEAVNKSMYFFTVLSGDTIKIAPGYSGIFINQGQEGTYTFAYDVVCPDGTVVETVTNSINVVTAAPYITSTPSLKYATALICDNTSGDAKINMLPTGGTRPFYYEYKLETSAAYIPTGNGGTDSVVSVIPVPPPGTIYDVRVVDACGKTATSKVSMSSFTGDFYIYQYPPDCLFHPFDTRVVTASVNGAYYTWKRNGSIIGQGFNLTGITILGITNDTISVDVNIFGCLNRSSSRVVVFTNPCNYQVLPVKDLKLSASRISDAAIKLNWHTAFEENLDHYEIEKSKNGIQFNYLASVTASNTGTTYSYNDIEPGSLIYYRLKVLDKYGAVIYSNVVKVANEKRSDVSFQISPNPSSRSIILKFSSKNEGTVKVKLYDTRGALLKEFPLSQEELLHGKIIDIESLNPGSYLISLIDSKGTYSNMKFIKL